MAYGYVRDMENVGENRDKNPRKGSLVFHKLRTINE